MFIDYPVFSSAKATPPIINSIGRRHDLCEYPRNILEQPTPISFSSELLGLNIRECR